MKKLLIAWLCALLCLFPLAGAEGSFSLFPDSGEAQPEEGADAGNAPSPSPEEKGDAQSEDQADAGGAFSLFPEETAVPALEGEAEPAPSESPDGGEDKSLPSFEMPAPAAGGTLVLARGDDEIALAFDPDPEFSFSSQGYVQASFYAYGERDELYELYLVFPEGVQSGTTVSDPADGENTAIFFYVTEVDGSGSLAVASQASGMPYPEGSSYSIYFGEVVQTGSARTFSGAFDATLVASRWTTRSMPPLPRKRYRARSRSPWILILLRRMTAACPPQGSSRRPTLRKYNQRQGYFDEKTVFSLFCARVCAHASGGMSRGRKQGSDWRAAGSHGDGHGRNDARPRRYL